MCGRIRLKRYDVLDAMMHDLGAHGDLIYNDDRAPTQTISIIRQREDGERVAEPATWWLLLELPDLKPSKLTCFNSRYDKLNLPKSLAYAPYRKSRCLIPATEFIETAGDPKAKIKHMIDEPGRALTFGGLYKTWLNRKTGELRHSASIITLPPVKGWEDIHPKSMPMLLDYKDTDLMAKWLDPSFDSVHEFDHLLQSKIVRTQRVTPIGMVSKWNAVGESFEIPGEAA